MLLPTCNFVNDEQVEPNVKLVIRTTRHSCQPRRWHAAHSVQLHISQGAARGWKGPQMSPGSRGVTEAVTMLPQVTSLEKAHAQMPTLDEVVSQCKQVCPLTAHLP